MGQNSSKEEWAQYNSKEFFSRQVELYRWRADPLFNTHICRVSFQPHASIRDREKLRNFLQADQIPLNELMALAGGSREGEQLMSLEQYICTLADLAERLSLQQVLYVLQAMFGGYETLLGKFGRCRVDLQCCFVTKQGQVRAWISPDYRSNQLEEERQGIGSIISSEMSLIRRILELGQHLASNHTEFLHFSRQFRSYMERDILQNWNFANARKLINSYVYTYRINLPPNIKQTAQKIAKSTPMHSQISLTSDAQSYQSQTQTSLIESKADLQSTGECFMRDGNNYSKKDSQRPLSHSDYSNGKKPESMSQHSLKSHSKKFSSTDLKNHVDRSKGFQSPKMSRSQLLPHKSKEQQRRNKEGFQYSSMQGQKMRRQRQFARVGEKEDMKLYNFSTTVGFSPDTNSFIQPDESRCHQYPNSSLKQNQQAKQKKKLQKKVATISKYISYYQQQSQVSHRSDLVDEQILNTQSKTVQFKPQALPNVQQKQNIPPSPSTNHKSKGDLKMTHKLSCQLKNMHAVRQVQSGRTEFNRSHGNSQHSNCSSSQDNTYPRMCFTVKTVNKLLQNNEVSLHQSNGSFMSIEQSEYSGALCKMGRSVDVANAPSIKQFNLQKKSNPQNAMNRSINC